MKKTSLLLCAAALFAACHNSPKADEAATTDQQEAVAGTGTGYQIDTTTSFVEWIGTKPTGQHTGSFTLSGGSLSVDDGQITGGAFVINLASLQNKDLKGEEKAQLEGHLKSPDFFDIAKYPSAKFEVTQVLPFDSSKQKSLLPGATHLISGNLTLKDSSKNVTFPAKVILTGKEVTAEAKFNIDRTLWGLNYKGPNNPQDWVIRKEVTLTLHLKAKQ